MIRRILILSVLIISYISTSANMSSPWQKGDPTSDAYSSKDIDILHESLHIKFIDFRTVKFTVIYRIKSDKSGKQIPLIFDTMTDKYAWKGLFNVWVDDHEVSVANIPSTYEDEMILTWLDSLDSHLLYSKENAPNMIGLKYFEVDLPEGEHSIRVEYTAQTGVYLGNPIKEYTVKYNLAPARYWRSFGGLDIEIDRTGLEGIFEVYHPDLGRSLTDPVSHLHFSEIPADELTIKCTPKVNPVARLVIAISPEIVFFILFFILTIVIIILHIHMVFKYRAKYPDKRYSPFAIAGSIIVPVICGFISVLSLIIIDTILGQHSTFERSGVYMIYALIVICLIALPFYLIIIVLLDRYKKNKLS